MTELCAEVGAPFQSFERLPDVAQANFKVRAEVESVISELVLSLIDVVDDVVSCLT